MVDILLLSGNLLLLRVKVDIKLFESLLVTDELCLKLFLSL